MKLSINARLNLHLKKAGRIQNYAIRQVLKVVLANVESTIPKEVNCTSSDFGV